MVLVILKHDTCQNIPAKNKRTSDIYKISTAVIWNFHMENGNTILL